MVINDLIPCNFFFSRSFDTSDKCSANASGSFNEYGYLPLNSCIPDGTLANSFMIKGCDGSKFTVETYSGQSCGVWTKTITSALPKCQAMDHTNSTVAIHTDNFDTAICTAPAAYVVKN